MSAVEAEDSGGSVTDADVKDPASKPRISYRFWVPVAVLAVAGFGVRLYSVLRWYQHLPLALDDNYYYHYQARLLADGRGFINPFYLRQQHIVAPSAAHPPMYSLYLAAWTLVGVGGVLDHRVVTCLAGATLCIPMAMLGRRLGGRWAGWIAAAFGAFFPPLWINDGLLLSETVAAISVAWAMVAALATFDRPRTKNWVLLGVACGIAALSRSELLALTIVLIPLIALLSAKSQASRNGTRSQPWLRRTLVTAVVGGAGAAIIVGPWVTRNMLTFEKPVTMSTGAGFVLEIANCDATYAGDMIGYWDPECSRTTWPKSADESVIEAELRTTGANYVAEHSKRFAAVAGIRVLRSFHLFNPNQGAQFDNFFERRPLGPVKIGMWLFYPTLLLAGVGVATLASPKPGARRRAAGEVRTDRGPDAELDPHVQPPASRYERWAMIGVLAVPVLAAVAATAGGIGITRYRTVADVAIAVAAAVGIVRLPETAKNSLAWLRTVAAPWLHRRMAGVLAVATAGALAVRWFVVLVTWPTCPDRVTENPDLPEGCFRVWGDALYSAAQGVLNGRGEYYKNGIAWKFVGAKLDSAGDPPFFAGMLGIVARFGGDQTPMWAKLLLGVALLGGLGYLVRRFFGVVWAGIAMLACTLMLGVVIGVGGESFVTQRLVGAAWGSVAVLFLAMAAHSLAGPVAAVTAATVAIVHPLFWLNDAMLMSESPYMAFVAIGIWATLRYWHQPNWPWLLTMGAAFSMASATRAETTTLFVLLIAPMVLMIRRLAWRTRLLHVGVVALIAIATLSPWLIWNSVRFREGSITTMTTGTGAVLGSASCDETFYGDKMGYWATCITEPFVATAAEPTPAADLVATSLHTDRFNDRMFALCRVEINGVVVTDPATMVPPGTATEAVLPLFAADPQECPTGTGVEPLDESERDNLVRSIALSYVGENKSRLPAISVIRVARMMSVYRPVQTWRWEYQIEGRGYWSSGIGMVMWWAMAIPAAGGLVWLWRRKLPVLPFTAIIAAICITAAGTFGINRYRVPVDMVEVVLFAVAVAVLLDRRGATAAANVLLPAAETDSPDDTEADAIAGAAFADGGSDQHHPTDREPKVTDHG